jgi:hypothetical protein
MRHIRIALLLMIVTAACGTGRPVAAPPTNGSTPTPSAIATATPTSPANASSTAATTAAPSGLLAMMLTDVRSGESFSLAQFEGKVTIVQHMAVW